MGTAAVVVVLVLSGCGGGNDEGDQASPGSVPSEADQAAITEVAVAVAATDDRNAPTTCRTLLTANFIKTVFKNQKLCARPSGEEPDEEAQVTVSDIAVKGDAGEATVSVQGGTVDGASGPWTFARGGGKWRVDSWSIEYLRSGYGKALLNYDDADTSDPLHNDQMRECIGTKLTTLDDDTFTAGIYEAIRRTKKGTQFFVGMTLDCGKTEVSPGVSLLRTVYETGARESLMEDYPAAFVDCVISDLRKQISDAELQKSYANASDGTPPALIAKYQQAGARCRGVAGT